MPGVARTVGRPRLLRLAWRGIRLRVLFHVRAHELRTRQRKSRTVTEDLQARWSETRLAEEAFMWAIAHKGQEPDSRSRGPT